MCWKKGNGIEKKGRDRRMKYIVDLPDAYTSESALLGDILRIPICLEGGKSYGIPTGIKLEPYTELNRKVIEDEVWEFAREMISTSEHEVSEMWGCVTNFGEVMHNTTYQEAKAKYEAWKDKKEEIRVGDEVTLQDGNFKYVVMGFHFNTAYLLASDGSVSKFPVSKLRKLNRHFNETEELLKKMREGKE